MREEITLDGSVTLFNEDHQDHYHSKSGAVEESFLKFCRPAKIAGRKEMKLLDIGFGIGYTCAAAIEEFFENGGERMELISLEIDPQVLVEMQKLNTPKLKYFEQVKLAAKNMTYSDDKLKINIILGDATQTIKFLPDEYFDVVFADGFAPTRNTELWTLEFFNEVAKKTKKGGMLTTYSYARHVRENLKSAGFDISDGPIIGRRCPSTVATKR